MNQTALQKKRKMLLVLPLLVVPFTTFFFWSQGGGKSVKSPAVNGQAKGLNTSLPDANVQAKPEDKLTLYQQALKDSEQLDQQRKQDPYNNLDTTGKSMIAWNGEAPDAYKTLPPSLSHAGINDPDPNEENVNRKLAQLEKTLQQPSYGTNDDFQQSDEGNDETIDKLQKTIHSFQGAQSDNTGTDPDLDKMDNMLDKIYNIQHPDAVNQQLAKESEKHKGIVYSLDNPMEQTNADLLAVQHNIPDSGAMNKQVQPTGFYELDAIPSSDSKENNKAIPAFINETQTLVSGSTLKMQLDADIFINGTDIPKGTQVFGACSLNGERMSVDVKSIRFGNELFPVNLSVYDLDGMPGIRIPGAITRDAIKEGANQGVQSMDLMTMSDNLAAQAASAGIQATKSLLGRKAKLVRATVRSGYPVLLKDNNKKDNLP